MANKTCEPVCTKKKCCKDILVSRIETNEDINNVIFQDNPCPGSLHIVQFDDYTVIYRYYNQVWSVAIRLNEGSSESSLIPVTYSELEELISEEELIPSQKYLLTDFATTHYFFSGDQTLTDSINVADEEPLILTALTTSSIHNTAMSVFYLQDIIHYDWNPSNWVNDTGFSDVDQEGLGNGTIIDGWKGVIYYREDTVQKNITHYDFRGVKFRRWSVSAPEWDFEEVYNRGDFVSLEGYVYVSLKGDNENNEVSDSEYWTLIANLNNNPYLSFKSSNVFGFTTDSDDFEDYLTFSEGYERLFHSNYIGTKKTLYDSLSVNTILPNIVFLISDDEYDGFQIIDNRIEGGVFFGEVTFVGLARSNRFGIDFRECIILDYFIRNTINTRFRDNFISESFSNNDIGIDFNNNVIGSSFSDNTIAYDFESNLIGTYFEENTIGNNFEGNTINNDFIRNVIGNNLAYNIIEYNFNDNVIGNYFSENIVDRYFSNNTIGNSFNNNTIGEYFYSNTVANNFITNVLGNHTRYNTFSNDVRFLLTPDKTEETAFKYNHIKNGVKGTSDVSPLDFTSATHVFSDYNTEIFINSDAENKLWYIDDSPALVVVNPTA
jgi:hypothetical protein